MGDSTGILIKDKGDIAERAIVVGDPDRVWQLASLLDDVHVVSKTRGYITVTGRYNGVKITIACHGVGGPSAAMAIEELIMLGARTIVRLGTAGAVYEGLELGDVIVPTASAYNRGGLYWQYLRSEIVYPAVPDFELTKALIEALELSGLRVFKGLVYSSDAFYAEEDLIPELRGKGVLAVEMETAALFIVSMLRRVKAAAVLVISNRLFEGRFARYLTSEELADIVRKVGRAILGVLTRL